MFVKAEKSVRRGKSDVWTVSTADSAKDESMLGITKTGSQYDTWTKDATLTLCLICILVLRAEHLTMFLSV